MKTNSAHITKTCEQCGNTFSVERWRSQAARFCSRRCADVSRRVDESVLTHKACSKCRKSLPVASFSWSSSKRKYHAYCKACARDYHVENRERVLSNQARRVATKRQVDWAAYRYTFLKRSAKLRRIPLLFNKEEFRAWYETQAPYKCAYCGLSLEQLRHVDIPMSVDRIDNAQGYALPNITLACLCCNKIKLDVLTYEDMQVIGQVVRQRLLSRFNCNCAKGFFGVCPHQRGENNHAG